ncbi:MAG: molybdenum ABC transporter ATP-binding protein [Pseudomonadota bacterium]
MLDINIKRQQGDFFIHAAFKKQQPGVTALFGPSGAGKTSIVNMVAGLTRPDEGHITINGRHLFNSDKNICLPPEKRRIGYVFQDGRLFPHLSVQSNLTYGMQKIPPAERYVTLDSVVDLLGISHLLERRPSKLSGGEKQRVAIGRALLSSPSMLLMDEPLASLDDRRKKEVLPFIQRLCTTFSLPILYVSHSLDEILNLASDMILLDSGKIAASGRIEDLINQPDIQHLLSPTDCNTIINTQVDSHDENSGLTHLKFSNGILKVFKINANLGDRIRIKIAARSIALSLKKPEQTSFQNILPGTIEKIIEKDGKFADVQLNIGCLVFARITLGSLIDLNLKPGMDVMVLIKSMDVSPGGFE